jgi:MFS family permease
MRLKTGDPNHTPYQMALAPAVTFAASLAWSVFLMGRIQRWHEFEQFVLFLYSVVLFAVAGVVLYFFIHGYTPFEATIFYSALVLQGAALANQLNASASMISEMIGQDDAASAIVFATFNIIESFSVGGTVFVIMSYSLVDEKEYLKIIIAIVPCLCAICQYIISRWRFKNRADQQYGYETAQSGDAGYNSIARAFSVRSNRARPEDGRSGI